MASNPARDLLFEQAMAALKVLNHDLGELRDIVKLRVIDPLGSDLTGNDAADLDEWVAGEPLDQAPALIMVNGSTHRCDVGASFAQVLADFASLAQDAVVDLTGKPWPQVVVEGRERVLDPMIDHGDAVWALAGVPYCPVGELTGRVSPSALVR